MYVCMYVPHRTSAFPFPHAQFIFSPFRILALSHAHAFSFSFFLSPPSQHLIFRSPSVLRNFQYFFPLLSVVCRRMYLLYCTVTSWWREAMHACKVKITWFDFERKKTPPRKLWAKESEVYRTIWLVSLRLRFHGVDLKRVNLDLGKYFSFAWEYLVGLLVCWFVETCLSSVVP